MKSRRNAIAIAGIRGGSGKTLVSIGIIRALRLSGRMVAPFKKGPDYIDPAWLGLAAERQCFNLDTFLMTEKKIIESFLGRNPDADIAVIEGNRGIFDGFDAEGTHSFAELIKITGSPVLLVVDCTKCSRTTAALVRGCMDFDRGITISGVILNQVAGERHRKVVTESVEKYCGIPVLGAVPRIDTPSFTERHLGLVPVHEQTEPDVVVEEIARTVLENVDISKIAEISQKHGPGLPATANMEPSPAPANSVKPAVEEGPPLAGKVRSERDSRPVIGIFRDAAFNFYYHENLELLESNGARLVYINSMEDGLPEIDGLYIGGGFPETHAERLSANTALRARVKELAEADGPVYAECGGLIYLSTAVVIDGESYPMAGIYPYTFTLSKKPQGHGYTIFEVDKENPFYSRGAVVRGHEFRYSRLVHEDDCDMSSTVFRVTRGKGFSRSRDGVLYKNSLATFCHTHGYGENVQWISSLVRMASAREWKQKR